MSRAFKFEYMPMGNSFLHCACARPANGEMVRIEALQFSEHMTLTWQRGPLRSDMQFTAAQARAVAAELLACADAIDPPKDKSSATTRPGQRASIHHINGGKKGSAA